VSDKIPPEMPLLSRKGKEEGSLQAMLAITKKTGV
jgi:hypothetical protein